MFSVCAMCVRCDAAAVRFDTLPVALLVDDRSGSMHPIKARFYEAHANRPRLKKKEGERRERDKPGKTGLTKKRVMNYSRP